MAAAGEDINRQNTAAKSEVRATAAKCFVRRGPVRSSAVAVRNQSNRLLLPVAEDLD